MGVVVAWAKPGRKEGPGAWSFLDMGGMMMDGDDEGAWRGDADVGLDVESTLVVGLRGSPLRPCFQAQRIRP